MNTTVLEVRVWVLTLALFSIPAIGHAQEKWHFRAEDDPFQDDPDESAILRSTGGEVLLTRCSKDSGSWEFQTIVKMKEAIGSDEPVEIGLKWKGDSPSVHSGSAMAVNSFVSLDRTAVLQVNGALLDGQKVYLELSRDTGQRYVVSFGPVDDPVSTLRAAKQQLSCLEHLKAQMKSD